MAATGDDFSTARDPSPTPVLDSEQINGLISAAGVDGAREILDAFWRSTDKLLAELKAQIAASDFKEAVRTAHALKGSALNVGAMRFSCAARGVEDASRLGDGALASKKLAGAEDNYKETVAAFDKVLAAAAA